jgi:quercetin 2,3-dioxygenase
MPVRIVPGEISAKDATTRAVIPTGVQPKWPPILRLAESIATPHRRFPGHGHEGVEVMTYVMEGSGLYSFEARAPEPIAVGSVLLLSAPTNVAHAVNPGKGQTLRWLAVVVALPVGTMGAAELQAANAKDGAVAADGTSTRYLVGAGSPLKSRASLEAVEISFVSEGTSFRRVGHASNAVGYATAGTGSIDGHSIEPGEAAIVEESAGVAIDGQPGFRLAWIQVPRPP